MKRTLMYKRRQSQKLSCLQALVHNIFLQNPIETNLVHNEHLTPAIQKLKIEIEFLKAYSFSHKKPMMLFEVACGINFRLPFLYKGDTPLVSI